MQPLLVWLPLEHYTRKVHYLCEAMGVKKTRSENPKYKRVWAVPEGGVDYREYDYSKVDIICFGPDSSKGPQPEIREDDDLVTIPGLPWPIFVDQAMAIILEHVRRRHGTAHDHNT